MSSSETKSKEDQPFSLLSSLTTNPISRRKETRSMRYSVLQRVMERFLSQPLSTRELEYFGRLSKVTTSILKPWYT